MSPRAKGSRTTESDTCGCRPAAEERESPLGALHRDEHRKSVDRRLARIEGQVRGLRRMVEERRWCIDVLVQVDAVRESLRAVADELLEAHLRHCVAEAARSEDGARVGRVLEEVAMLLRRRKG